MSKSQRSVSLFKLLFAALTRNALRAVIGPNLKRNGNPSEPLWSVRLEHQRGNDAVPLREVCLSNIDYVSADRDEAPAGCSSRVVGTLVPREEVEGRLIPLKFTPSGPSFNLVNKDGTRGSSVYAESIQYLVLGANGNVRGVLKPVTAQS